MRVGPGHPVGSSRTPVRLFGQPASPVAGSSQWRIMVAVGDRIDGWWGQRAVT